MKNQGFTFLELLIVMAIITIIAVLLIPNLIDARHRALDAQAQACLKEISTVQAVIFVVDKQFSTDIQNAADYPEDTCRNIDVVTVTSEPDFFEYTGTHPQSGNVFRVAADSGVSQDP